MNKTLLKSKMALNNDNDRSLAEKMKITPASFSNKIRGKSKFTINEMNNIRKIYKLTDREFVEIFIE